MSRNFSNPEPITLDVSFDEPVTTDQENLDFGEPKETTEPNPEDSVVKTPTTEESESESESEQDGLQIEPVDTDIKPVDKEPEEEYASNPYLQTINSLLEKRLFDPENLYEGFSDETEPSEEVLERFIEHNMELREEQAVRELFEGVSPLTQRLLQFDLNAKGQGIESYVKTLIEETNIKSLNPENEYDQEKIVDMWYRDESFTAEEVKEKIEDLKNAGLLSKEASRLKPKLDAKAEEIAKQQEESQKVLAQIEAQRKQGFYQKVEQEIKTGKVDGIPVSKEDANSILNLLFAEDVRLRLPEGREVKMNALEAEVFKHKYSNQGDVKLLLKAALLLTNPEKFHKHYAQQIKTEEVNKFVKQNKYNTISSQPKPQTPKEANKVGWYKPK